MTVITMPITTLVSVMISRTKDAAANMKTKNTVHAFYAGTIKLTFFSATFCVLMSVRRTGLVFAISSNTGKSGRSTEEEKYDSPNDWKPDRDRQDCIDLTIELSKTHANVANGNYRLQKFDVNISFQTQFYPI